MTVAEGRTEYDVGMIFREYGQVYERTHDMNSEQRKAMRALAVCRTSYLGGHLLQCSNCGHEQPEYNSCRNGNCPKCQGINRRKWVEDRLDELLPVPYFHTVFTIPSQIHGLTRDNPREIYNLLFRSSADTVLHLFRKASGGVPAITGVLHTWGQTMSLHPHIHMLVTAGGLSTDGTQWIPRGGGWLFDVREMSREFKRRFFKGLEKLVRKRQLGIGEVYRTARRMLRAVEDSGDWVVFCKKPFAGAEKVVEYLGRYTYRTAIANSRIQSVANGKVNFDYKDYSQVDTEGKPIHRVMELEAGEFIRRFMQHIPPKGFRRIRFYGISGGTDRAEKLEICRQFIPPDETASADDEEGMQEEYDRYACPQCGTGRMAVAGDIPEEHPPPLTFRNERERDAA